MECLFIDETGNRDGLRANVDGSYATLDQQTGALIGPAVDIVGLPPLKMVETSVTP